jgi:DNA polymerase-3 subunit delta
MRPFSALDSAGEAHIGRHAPSGSEPRLEMTIVSTANAEGFIDRLPANIAFFLAHGPDEGLAHERSRAIIGKLIGADPDPLRLVRLEGDALARRPEVLADEAYAVSMFGGSRAIWIDAQGRDLSPALVPLFARTPNDCAIVIKAGQLKKGHALRVTFEKAANAASIECYSDDSKTLGSLIDGALRQAGMTIEADARAALVNELGADRRTSRSEIEKLILYARGKQRIDLDDVRAIVSDTAPSPLDELVDLAMTGDLQGVAETAGRYFRESGDADQLIGRLIARLSLLHRLRLEIEAGQSFEGACQSLYIRLPFDARRALAKSAERWSAEAIAERLPSIRALSANVRGSPDLGEFLASRALWSLASARRRAAGR